MMTLIDTSCWIEALRENGDATVRNRVLALLDQGQACWCDAVRIELWNGRGAERQKASLEQLDEELTCFAVNQAVWQLSIEMAKRARAGGVTVPAMDLLIAACARVNGLTIESTDKHFAMLATV